jgi:alpha-galactosidase
MGSVSHCSCSKVMINAESALSASCGQTKFAPTAGKKLWVVDAEPGGTMLLQGSREVGTITATRVSGRLRLDATNPANEWLAAEPVRFSADWHGKNSDPAFETEVRVLWSPDTLYLRFLCHYHDLSVFEDCETNGRRDHLWDRDVAEAFLQPPESLARTGGSAHASKINFQRKNSPAALRTTSVGARGSKINYENVEKDFDAPYARYKEFEIAPNGMWIDLDIIPGGRGNLRSGLTRSVDIDERAKIWTAEMAIPMRSLTSKFDSNENWRVNFYRVEGKAEPRKYLAWQPTMAAQPNFHVPEKFGRMRFR